MALFYQGVVFTMVVIILLSAVLLIGTVTTIVGIVCGVSAKKKQQPAKHSKILLAIGIPLTAVPVIIFTAMLINTAISFSSYKSPDRLTEEYVTSFFEKFDCGDTDGVYRLFAENVRSENPKLTEQIEAFIENHPAHPDTNECDGADGEMSSTNYGKRINILRQALLSPRTE